MRHTWKLRARFSVVAIVGCLSCTSLPAAERHISLNIVRRQIEKIPPTIRVQQGDRLVLEWRSDESVSAHLHGYDILLPLKPVSEAGASPQLMKLTASIPGRFPLSAHGFASAGKSKHQAEVTLLYLEVLPP